MTLYPRFRHTKSSLLCHTNRSCLWRAGDSVLCQAGTKYDDGRSYAGPLHRWIRSGLACSPDGGIGRCVGLKIDGTHGTGFCLPSAPQSGVHYGDLVSGVFLKPVHKVPVMDRKRRIYAAAAIGLSAAIFFVAMTRETLFDATTDMEFWWRASRLWLHGVDPFLARPHTAIWPLPDRLYYPMPALIFMVPFAELSLRIAGAFFVGASSAWLCWMLSESGAWRLWLLATPAFVMAVRLGQWSPLITAAALVPSAGFLLSSKPTLGLAAFFYHPRWRAAIGIAVVLAVSVAVLPTWPVEWLSNLHSVRSHPAPIATPFGWLLLLALLRWRQPEARLLVAMACVPQLLFFADQLVLGLVARTKAEAEFYAGCGIAASLVWLLRLSPHDPNLTGLAAPYVMLGCYLPALALVLHRPDEGVA